MRKHIKRSKLSPYQESRFSQLTAWVDGVPKHDREYNMCCLDSSCCYPFLSEDSQDKRVDMLEELCKDKILGAELVKSLQEFIHEGL